MSLQRWTAALLLAAAIPAQAQTINYSEMEELFGEPVTTSATGSPQRRSEVPVTMDIVTSEEIRRAGATTIPQILERISGIDVFTTSNNSADVAVRGLNQGGSNRLLLLINGREQYTDALGTLVWELLPIRMDEIRQIEVIKGPNSALYGYNAAAGVINIITFSPVYDITNVERLSAGSSGYGAASFVRTEHWEGGGIRLSAGYSQVDESNFHPGNNADLIAAKVDPSIVRTVNFDTQTQVGDSTAVRLQGGFASSTLRTQAQVPARLGGLVGTGVASVTSDTAFGTVEASVSHSHYELSDLRFAFGTGGPPANDVTVAKLEDLFKLGSQDTIRLAAEYRRDTMPTWPSPGGNLQSQDEAVSIAWNHAFTPNLTWLNAARGEHFTLGRTGSFIYGEPYSNQDYDRTILDGSYNSALVWRPTQLDSIKLSVARGLQLPSLSEFGIMGAQSITVPGVPTITADFLGNPTLPPSTVMHYELSYERQVDAIHSSVRLAGFHQDVRQLRDVGPFALTSLTPTPLALGVYEVLGNARINGLELDLKGRLGDGWRWNANYSLEGVTTTVPVFIRDYARSAPTHKVNLQLGYTTGPWEADLYLRYASRIYEPEQVSLDVFQSTLVSALVEARGRVAYHITPKLLVEAIAVNGYADNPISRQRAQGFVSLVANF